MKIQDIKPDGFSIWLQEKGKKIVGYSHQSCNCPITNYLKTIDPNVFATAKGTLITIDTQKYVSDYDELPDWCGDFIDNLDAVWANHESIPIRGNEALILLQEVTNAGN